MTIDPIVPLAPLTVVLGANPRVFNCADVSGTTVLLGAFDPDKKSTRYSVPRGYAPEAEDGPSFLHAIALSQDHEQLSDVKCSAQTFAVAELHWRLPNMRPNLFIRDTGPRPEATGEITHLDGKPVSYRVAGGDNFASIAKRLHISVNDIFYVNPQRGIGEDPSAKIGEAINLSRVLR